MKKPFRFTYELGYELLIFKTLLNPLETEGFHTAQSLTTPTHR